MRWLTAGLSAGVVAGAVGHEFLRDWGASELERVEYLPGDECVPGPAISSTLAVDIDASASEIWSWLVQIGQDRAGMYSYDRLESLLGLRIRNADRVNPDWQTLEPGDSVRLVPRGWLGLADGLALPVERVEPGKTLVLRMQRPQLPWDAVWSFHIVEAGGPWCRLISRSRGAQSTGVGRALDALFNPVTWLMTRRMLLGIKARAERAERAQSRPDRAVVTHHVHAARPSHDQIHAAAISRPAADRS
jgi:hypothetical protein